MSGDAPKLFDRAAGKAPGAAASAALRCLARALLLLVRRPRGRVQAKHVDASRRKMLQPLRRRVARARRVHGALREARGRQGTTWPRGNVASRTCSSWNKPRLSTSLWYTRQTALLRRAREARRARVRTQGANRGAKTAARANAASRGRGRPHAAHAPALHEGGACFKRRRVDSAQRSLVADVAEKGDDARAARRRRQRNRHRRVLRSTRARVSVALPRSCGLARSRAASSAARAALTRRVYRLMATRLLSAWQRRAHAEDCAHNDAGSVGAAEARQARRRRRGLGRWRRRRERVRASWRAGQRIANPVRRHVDALLLLLRLRRGAHWPRCAASSSASAPARNAARRPQLQPECDARGRWHACRVSSAV